MGVFVSDAVVLQYVGFETKGAIREYAFTLRGTGGAYSKYFVTIAKDFVAHLVRYQDAPDLCSLKLHREMAKSVDDPLKTHYRISGNELDDYRDSHS